MSFLSSVNDNYFWRELLPSHSCCHLFLGWLWRWRSGWHGWLFCFQNQNKLFKEPKALWMETQTLQCKWGWLWPMLKIFMRRCIVWLGGFQGEIQLSVQNNSALHYQDHSEPLWALYGTHPSEMEHLLLLSCWFWIPNPIYVGKKGHLFAS